MVLETQRLLLREMEPDDFQALFPVLGDPETMRHYPYTFDAQHVRDWIDGNMNRYRKDGFGLWAVCLKDTGEMIGDCGLTLQNINGEMLPEIGYHIRCDCQRKGYANEAAKAVRDWAFRNTDYQALYSCCKYTNVPSVKTAESIGMHFVCEYPDETNGTTHVSAISREEWLNENTERSDEQEERAEKMNRKALVVIDMQNDITKHYRDIIDRLNAAIEWAAGNGMEIVYIQHNNLSAGTRTFKPGTKGAEPVPELRIVSDHVFTKTKASALTSEAFSEFIRSKELREFYITGADATACVKSTCFNMTKAGYAVHVISDCVTSYDPEKMPEMLAYYADRGCEVRSLAFYMGMNYQYKRLDNHNFTGHSLDDFVRHQTVTECLRKTGSDWKLVANVYEENWSQAQCREIADDIARHINLDQTGFGAFDGGRIIGFATVSHRLFGTAARYAQLVCLQVSEEYRRRGIGRKLFSMACAEARRLGAEKLYISAHSSKESQAAYRALGCSFAEEINEELAAEEPFDVQMEYRL